MMRLSIVIGSSNFNRTQHTVHISFPSEASGKADSEVPAHVTISKSLAPVHCHILCLLSVSSAA